MRLLEKDQTTPFSVLWVAVVYAFNTGGYSVATDYIDPHCRKVLEIAIDTVR